MDRKLRGRASGSRFWREMALVRDVPLLQFAESDVEPSGCRRLLPWRQAGRADFYSQAPAAAFLLYVRANDEYYQPADQRFSLQLSAQLLGAILYGRTRPGGSWNFAAAATTRTRR